MHDVLTATDWPLLAAQKATLVETISDLTLAAETERARHNPVASARLHEQAGSLTGLLNWIDSVQDAAEQNGHPVVFLTSPDGPDAQTSHAAATQDHAGTPAPQP